MKARRAQLLGRRTLQRRMSSGFRLENVLRTNRFSIALMRCFKIAIYRGRQGG